jgi:hypothetical protein
MLVDDKGINELIKYYVGKISTHNTGSVNFNKQG